MKSDIIYEDDFLIAVNKPSGLLSIPDREGKEISLKELLHENYSEIFTVHRLDKATSGVIIFTKDQITHKQLSQLFENHTIEKIYNGLVKGTVLPEKGKIEAPVMQHPSGNNKMIISEKGKQSLTEYEVLEKFKLYSWLKFIIRTGRTHQIRIHAQYIGNSIVCDELYGSAAPVFLSSLKNKYHLAKKEELEKPILARLALHAASIKFNLNNKAYSFEAPLPKDLKAILQQLKKINAV